MKKRQKKKNGSEKELRKSPTENDCGIETRVFTRKYVNGLVICG